MTNVDDQHAPEHVTKQAPGMSPCPDPWAHIRAHAAEGGVYASAIAQLGDRLQVLERRLSFQPIHTDRDTSIPCVLVPAQPERCSEASSPGSLKQELREALADANGNRDWSWEMEAEAALLTIAAWLERQGNGTAEIAALWLHEEAGL